MEKICNAFLITNLFHLEQQFIIYRFALYLEDF